MRVACGISSPKIEIPIFIAGRNKANLTLAQVRQQQSIVSYEQKIQTAFKEVADALSLRESISGQLTAQQRFSGVPSDNAATGTRFIFQRRCKLYRSPGCGRTLFSTQQAILDLRYAQHVNEINLFTALSGGWTE